MDIQLSLLRYFDALVSRESVSAAAAAVGLTQPAMSIALGRLRRALGDPVLVRTRAGMVATEHAKALLPEVRELLQRADALGRPRGAFRPDTGAAHFSIALMDSIAALLVPALVRRLAELAPRALLSTRATNHDRLQEWFDAGAIHLGIGYHPSPPGHLHARVIFADTWALVMRRAHPSARRRQQPDVLLDAPMVKVSPSSSDIYWNLVAQAMARTGRTPAIGTTVPSFLVAAHVVAATDFVACLPMRYARLVSAELPLRVLPMPLALPALAFGMRWHERTHRLPEHRWFRDIALECSRIVMAAGRSRARA
jgi:DNA-binding transcriptional LysR family regulator